jgi:DNA-binding transcriptional LysR family regulator
VQLSLDAIALIDLIARRGSFGAAARELGRVPSALTYQIRRLEDMLDVLIFDRRNRGARLTAAGEALLDGGRRLLADAHDLQRTVHQVASGWEPELRIALDATIAFERLAPLIRDFDRLGAPTRLRFSEEVLHGCWDALFDSRCVLAIGAAGDPPAPLLDGQRFGIETLGDVRFVFCVAPSHPLAQARQPVEDTSLLAHRAIVIADSSRGLSPGSAGLLAGQATLTVSGIAQKLAAQIDGLGCGYLPMSQAAAALAEGRLIALTRRSERPALTLRYAWLRAGRGRALEWWLSRLAVARVRGRLLGTGRIGRARSASPSSDMTDATSGTGSNPTGRHKPQPAQPHPPRP